MSDLEEALLVQIENADLPSPVREVSFHPHRRWRFDFFYPDEKVACEVEGGVYIQGRHSRGKGFEGDCEKYNEAAAMGITGLRVTAKHIKDGRAIEWLTNVLNNKNNKWTDSEAAMRPLRGP